MLNINCSNQIDSQTFQRFMKIENCCGPSCTCIVFIRSIIRIIPSMKLISISHIFLFLCFVQHMVILLVS